uniref:Large ribosomal subunit protein bL33c n=1 Tax=Hommersandiophycus borowitzkae TaxID=268573 RepID=A0A1G4NU56_9FLOR|nr:Ribosomal protein L33 [Hommersandiophycus borowitzkae]SCW22167.1 Ribosomal protein L33 [Hommersandiophycus borowitzkae]
MGKSKGARITITLECECRSKSNSDKRANGIFRYTSSKNRRNTPNRIELRKFCRQCNCHAIFKEIK